MHAPVHTPYDFLYRKPTPLKLLQQSYNQRPAAAATAVQITRLRDEVAQRVQHEPQQLDVLALALAAHKHGVLVRVLQ